MTRERMPERPRRSALRDAAHAPWQCTTLLALLIGVAGCGRSPAAPAAQPSAPAAVQAVPVTPVTAQQIRSLVAAGTNTVTLLHFWASWCPPCVEELPVVVKLAKTYRGKGLRVLLVSADAPQDSRAVTQFLSERQVDWPTYLATNLDDDFIKVFAAQWSGAIPTSFFYAADGSLATWWEGAHDAAAFEQVVARLLNQAGKGGTKP